MASKKPVVTRTVRPAAKTKAPAKWQPWTLPVVLLMLIVGAAGLLFAVREASNAPQAAAPVIGPAAGASPSEASSAKAESAARPPAAPAARAAAPVDGTRPAGVKPVSITGCVQRADAGFVLKNTEGTEAPRSRSWKSGFLRRSSVTVGLIDTGDAAHLSTHVGQRVSVTGPLLDRDMHVLSLRRLSATCQ